MRFFRSRSKPETPEEIAEEPVSPPAIEETVSALSAEVVDLVAPAVADEILARIEAMADRSLLEAIARANRDLETSRVVEQTSGLRTMLEERSTAYRGRNGNGR